MWQTQKGGTTKNGTQARPTRDHTQKRGCLATWRTLRMSMRRNPWKTEFLIMKTSTSTHFAHVDAQKPWENRIFENENVDVNALCSTEKPEEGVTRLPPQG